MQMCVRQKGVSLGFFWGGGRRNCHFLHYGGGGLRHNSIMGSSSACSSDWTRNGFKPCLRECLLWLILDFGFSSARASAPSTPIIFEAFSRLTLAPQGADNINLWPHESSPVPRHVWLKSWTGFLGYLPFPFVTSDLVLLWDDCCE